jgi:hypothetical protein
MTDTARKALEAHVALIVVLADAAAEEKSAKLVSEIKARCEREHALEKTEMEKLTRTLLEHQRQRNACHLSNARQLMENAIRQQQQLRQISWLYKGVLEKLKNERALCGDYNEQTENAFFLVRTMRNFGINIIISTVNGGPRVGVSVKRLDSTLFVTRPGHSHAHTAAQVKIFQAALFMQHNNCNTPVHEFCLKIAQNQILTKLGLK